MELYPTTNIHKRITTSLFQNLPFLCKIFDWFSFLIFFFGLEFVSNFQSIIYGVCIQWMKCVCCKTCKFYDGDNDMVEFVEQKECVIEKRWIWDKGPNEDKKTYAEQWQNTQKYRL